MVCGEEDMQGSFQMEYYEPYINSNICSSKAECSIEKESARESYDGVCDDCRLGLNLIFSVNNNFLILAAFVAWHCRDSFQQ